MVVMVEAELVEKYLMCLIYMGKYTSKPPVKAALGVGVNVWITFKGPKSSFFIHTLRIACA